MIAVQSRTIGSRLWGSVERCLTVVAVAMATLVGQSIPAAHAATSDIKVLKVDATSLPTGRVYVHAPG